MNDILLRLGEIFGAVTIYLVGSGLFSLISALILQLVTKWVCGDKLTYWKAYKICFSAYFITSLIALFLRILFAVPFNLYASLLLISHTVFKFLLFPKLFKFFTKESNFEAVGYRKISLLGFVYITINIICLFFTIWLLASLSSDFMRGLIRGSS